MSGDLAAFIVLAVFVLAVVGVALVIQDAIRSLARRGLLSVVLVLLGVSWLFGSEDDGGDC